MNEPHFIFPFILDFNVLIILDQYTQIFAYVYKIYKMYSHTKNTLLYIHMYTDMCHITQLYMYV